GDGARALGDGGDRGRIADGHEDRLRADIAHVGVVHDREGAQPDRRVGGDVDLDLGRRAARLRKERAEGADRRKGRLLDRRGAQPPSNELVERVDASPSLSPTPLARDLTKGLPAAVASYAAG